MTSKDVALEAFIEDQELLRANTELEFNTISVVLEQSAKKFLKTDEYMKMQRSKELKNFQKKKVENKGQKKSGGSAQGPTKGGPQNSDP